MNLKRLFRHLFFPGWWSHRRFPDACMARIEAAIAESERHHHGEICFAVETNLDLIPLWRGHSPRARALEVFAGRRVWDTEANNGVLVYLLLADREVEVVADRDLARRIEPGVWEDACREMERHFATGDYCGGALAGIARIDTQLRRLYPRAGEDVNELPNRPLRL